MRYTVVVTDTQDNRQKPVEVFEVIAADARDARFKAVRFYQAEHDVDPRSIKVLTCTARGDK